MIPTVSERPIGMRSDEVVDAVWDDLRAVLADEVAFRRWYERYLPPVYSYLVSRSLGDTDLAEDLAQDVFIAAIRGRAAFDGRSDPVTWLIGIARHKLADHFRGQEREERRRLRVEVREVQLDREHASWRHLEERVHIAEAMSRLPAAQRAVLTFVALDDLPVADAARLMGRSFGATQSLLARAREGFRRLYEREADR
jgi:RNA polymerase sigma-70 factor (ECF subfamily)